MGLKLGTISHDYNITVLTHPGSGTELAVLKSLAEIKRLKPDLIIITTGICDLTYKSLTTKKVGLRHDQVAINADHVLQAMASAYDLIRAHGDVMVSFATVTGVDMADYNHPGRKQMNLDRYLEYCTNEKVAHADQSKLNDSVLEINRRIVKLNKGHSAKTVWLAGLIHAYYNKSYHHCYKRLWDGCHPDAVTTRAWACQIVKSIGRIAL